MQTHNTRNSRFLSLFLAISMIISILPLNVFAGNNDTAPIHPKTKDASDKPYKFMDTFKGIRLSIYWAPTLEDFKKTSKSTLLMNNIVDFTILSKVKNKLLSLNS